MYRLGPCILIFRCFLLIKSAKRMCMCEYFKNRIGTYKKCVSRLEKEYKRIIVLDSCKTYWFSSRKDLFQQKASVSLSH